MADRTLRGKGEASAPVNRDTLECRRFEVAGLAVELRQDVRGSGALRPLSSRRGPPGDDDDCGAVPEAAQLPGGEAAKDLSRVGLAAWQAGFALADYLLRRPPFGSWHGLSVLDLGSGTGLVGILLALAGAEVTLSDQPHVTPLAEENARANLTPGLHRFRAVDYVWGQGDAAAALLPPPARAAQPSRSPPSTPVHISGTAAAEASLRSAHALEGGEGVSAPVLSAGPAPSFDCITAADCVYEPECYADLATTLRALSAPHTLLFLAFKRRGLQEESFLEMLEAAGFAVQDVPAASLAPEYSCGTYRVLRVCRID